MDECNIMEDKTFFYSNACQFCKRWDVELRSCDGCRMVSYCNEAHQRQHWPGHQEICGAIKFVLEGKEYMNTEEISEEEWYYIRQAYANKVANKLQRNLKNEEFEMIMFPKSCIVCHRQDTAIRCNECPSAAFCDKHRYTLVHREDCLMLTASFNLHKIWALTEGIDISYIDRIPKNTGTVISMTSFLDTYLPFDKNREYLSMLHSDILTRPLTVYFCIKELYNGKYNMLSIHVIGPRIISFEKHFKVWTIILLLIPKLTNLTITFIQTENMLSKCDIFGEVLEVSDTKRLVVNVCCMPYEVYMGTADYMKPQLIVGIESYVIDGSYAKDIYVDISEISGKALAAMMCPCVLIFEYIQPIHKQMLKEIKSYMFRLNPFASTTLHRRSYKTERIIHIDEHLIIFANLISNNVSLFIDEKNKFALFTKTSRNEQ